MNHFLTERLNRRGFLRMAGASTVGAAVLAACRKAENVGGGATGTSGAAVHPPIGQEPGNLQVFDWSGYGNGDYYPDKERLALWKQYFIPLDWGFIAPIVNLDHVDVKEETFGILFDDRYAGKISWVDTSNMMYIGALFLGVADPFDMTDDELAQVRDFLISKKHLVKFLWNQSYEFWLSFKKEEVWIGYAWPDTVGYADAAGMNYLYMTPKEGRVSWVCGMGLAADTENYRHAHAYV